MQTVEARKGHPNGQPLLDSPSVQTVNVDHPSAHLIVDGSGWRYRQLVRQFAATRPQTRDCEDDPRFCYEVQR